MKADRKGAPGLRGYFELDAHRTNAKTEVIAGATTFLTMAYIIIVNPVILSNAGMPFGPAMVATIMASAFATLLTGLYAKRPFAMAPYMGENAFFAFTIVVALGQHWTVALGAVFIAGLIFVLVTLSGLRKALAEVVPPFLSASWAVAIGLFLIFVGLANSGVSLPFILGAPVTIGNLARPEPLLVLFGTALTALLMVRRAPGSILIGIAVTMALGFILGAAGLGGSLPKEVPPLLGPIPDWTEVLFRLDVLGALQVALMPIIAALFLMDLIDTMGTLIGLGAKAGFLDERGRFPKLERPMQVDALATVVGSLFGTSTTGTYIESASGIGQGGRTGLTAMVVGLLFLASLAMTPFFSNLPVGFLQLVTAPALIIVGILMTSPIRLVNFDDYTEAIPAVLTMAFMIFTFNIGFGLAAGLVAYPLAKLAAGRVREVHPSAWVLWLLALILFFAYPYS